MTPNELAPQVPGRTRIRIRNHDPATVTIVRRTRPDASTERVRCIVSDWRLATDFAVALIKQPAVRAVYVHAAGGYRTRWSRGTDSLIRNHVRRRSP